MRWSYLLPLGALVCASGCATSGPPPVQTQRVDVAVPVRCDPDIGPQPAYPDSDVALRAASGLFDRVRLMVAGRLMRMEREGELNAGLTACEAGGTGEIR
jgi:hypothetical protein